LHIASITNSLSVFDAIVRTLARSLAVVVVVVAVVVVVVVVVVGSCRTNLVGILVNKTS
jgi:hypothetical protein